MKVVISYPPLESRKGIPLLSQNRQFQWAAGGPLAYFIYPVIPAYAATMLKNAGHEVVWLDGLAEKWSYRRWLYEVKKAQPDLLVMETKTPVVKQHWRIINKVKRQAADVRCILVGDHVTALPEESFKNSSVDYVLTGGDYDFLLLNLVNYLTKKEKLESGIWYRSTDTSEVCRRRNTTSEVKSTGKFRLSHDLSRLPLIDRKLTKWRLYAFKNSNFYRAPGAYTMFGRDCWWGKCTFCSWSTLFPGAHYRVMPVKKALDEVGNLIKNHQVKEIMDDSGTFPVDEWLKEFCQGMIKRGYHKKIRMNCNMRFNAGLNEKDYQLMGKAGFRFILYGLESARQETLDRLNKNLKVAQIEPALQIAKKAGLMPHLTIMVGYPWETEEDLQKTIEFTVGLFKKGLVDSLQATLVMPYPGTPLFKDCNKSGLLKTKNWQDYDMTKPVIETKVSNKKLLSAVRGLYSRSIWTPQFIFNTFSQLRSIDGLKYVGFQTLKYLAKLWEFK